MEWYYSSEGQQLGPVDDNELKEKIRGGEVKPGDLIWSDGMGDWQPVSKVPEMAIALPGATAASTDTPTAVPTEEAAAQTEVAQPSPYSAPQSSAPAAPMAGGNVEGSGKATAGLVLGICSIVLSCIPCLGLICGILGIVFSGQFTTLMQSRPELAPFESRAKTGRITSIVGIILSVIFLLISVVMNVTGGIEYNQNMP